MTVDVTLPIRTFSEANMRDGWRRHASRKREQRGITRLALRPRVRGLPLPVVVTLTRSSPRRLDDDNLRGALKHVRDGVADALGLEDDSDPRVLWLYRQAAGPHGVRILVVRAR